MCRGRTAEPPLPGVQTGSDARPSNTVLLPPTPAPTGNEHTTEFAEHPRDAISACYL